MVNRYVLRFLGSYTIFTEFPGVLKGNGVGEELLTD
jgi:hypothetical protein